MNQHRHSKLLFTVVKDKNDSYELFANTVPTKEIKGTRPLAKSGFELKTTSIEYPIYNRGYNLV